MLRIIVFWSWGFSCKVAKLQSCKVAEWWKGLFVYMCICLMEVFFWSLYSFLLFSFYVYLDTETSSVHVIDARLQMLWRLLVNRRLTTRHTIIIVAIQILRNGKCPKSLRSGHDSGIGCRIQENYRKSRFLVLFINGKE